MGDGEWGILIVEILVTPTPQDLELESKLGLGFRVESGKKAAIIKSGPIL